jgi:carbon storage regulator CsrA
MLLLSRRLNEDIVINNCIRVRLVAIQGNRVRLGVLAPADVAIERNEVGLRKRLAGSGNGELLSVPDRPEVNRPSE